jgi:hypothetical protein
MSRRFVLLCCSLIAVSAAPPAWDGHTLGTTAIEEGGVRLTLEEVSVLSSGEMSLVFGYQRCEMKESEALAAPAGVVSMFFWDADGRELLVVGPRFYLEPHRFGIPKEKRRVSFHSLKPPEGAYWVAVGVGSGAVTGKRRIPPRSRNLPAPPPPGVIR